MTAFCEKVLGGLKLTASQATGTSAFLESISSEGKTKIFSYFYEKHRDFLKKHFINKSNDSSDHEKCWCSSIDIGLHQPLREYFSTIAVGCDKHYLLSDTFMSWSRHKLEEGKLLFNKGWSLANKAGPVYQDMDHLDVYLLEGYRRGLTEKLLFLDAILKNLLGLQSVIQASAEDFRKNSFKSFLEITHQNSPVEENGSDPELSPPHLKKRKIHLKRRKISNSENKNHTDEEGNDKIENSQENLKKNKSLLPLKPYSSFLIGLFCFSLCIIPCYSTNYCQPELSQTLMKTLESNLTDSYDNLDLLKASPFDNRSDRIGNNTFTYMIPLVNWEGYLEAEKFCKEEGGELFNPTQVEFVGLVEKFRPLEISFFLPVTRSANYVKEKKEEYFIGKDTTFLVTDPTNKGLSYSIVVIETDQNPIKSHLCFPYDPLVVIQDDFAYPCKSVSDKFDRADRLALWVQETKKIINSVRDLISRFLVLNDQQENHDNCVGVELAIYIPTLTPDLDIYTIDGANERKAKNLLKDFNSNLNSAYDQLNSFINDKDYPDIDHQYWGNIFKRLANLDLQESDDLTFLIFVILLVLLAIFGVISLCCISFCRKKLAKQTLRGIIKSHRINREI